jgi:hypothetical protein
MTNSTQPTTVNYNYGTKTRQTLGNILDLYDSPMYNIRLYMIPFLEVKAADALNDVEGGSGSFVSPNEVTIAQTGVTGLLIDDVSVELFGGAMRLFEPRKVTFKITEPGSVEFLDKLTVLRTLMGYSFTGPDGVVVPEGFPIFMEIKFLGYPLPEGDDPREREDNARASEAEQIGPLFRYRLEVNRIEMKIDTTGSVYDFSAVVMSSIGTNDIYFKAPKEITTRGTTTNEHLTDFIENLNKIEEDHNTTHIAKDQYALDIEPLLADLRDSGLSTGDLLDQPIDYDSFNFLDWARLTDPSLRNMSPEQFNDLSESELRSQVAILVNNGSALTSQRRDDADQRRRAEIAEREPAGGIVSSALRGAFDIGSGAFTAAGRGLDDARGAIGNVVSGEGNQLPPITIRRGVSYDYYMFMLFALGLGDTFYELVTRGDPNPDTPRDTLVRRLVVSTRVELLDFDIGRRGFSKKITYIPRMISGNFENHALTSREDTNLTAEEIESRFNQLVVDKFYSYMFTGLNDQILNMDISYNQAIAILLSPYQGAHTSVEQTTSSNSGENEDTVRQSIQQIRSGDDFDITNTSSRSEQFSFTYLEDIDTSSDVEVVQQRYETATMDQPSAGADSTNDSLSNARSNRIANLYTNSMEEVAKFMHRQELTLRGDPYYLGTPDIQSVRDEFVISPREVIVTPSQHIPVRDLMPHYVFEMQLPRLEQENPLNDDDNTGLWDIRGKSYFLTGLYMIRSVTNTFSDGRYECKVSGIRQTMFNAALIDEITSSVENELPEQPRTRTPQLPPVGDFEVNDDNPVPVQGTNPLAGDPNAPRSVRNNNPGNIRLTNIPWEGKVGNDGEFEIFDTQENGGRALMRNLRTRVETLGDNATMTNVITAWAPPNENDTPAYIEFVRQQTGIGPDQVLDWNNRAQMSSIARAIAIKETGVSRTPDDWKNPIWWNSRYREANSDRTNTSTIGIV